MGLFCIVLLVPRADVWLGVFYEKLQKILLFVVNPLPLQSSKKVTT